MKRQLSIVQHHPAEGPGEIGVWADRLGVTCTIHRADLGELPVGDIEACVLLGGPHAVSDPPDWMRREKAWLGERIAGGTRLLGVCLGSQLLAEALGGSVHRLERPETGWHRVEFADGSRLDVLQWHEDAFTLPPGAERLGRNVLCEQMFRAGARHLGIQFHPEWNPLLVAALNDHFGDASPLPRVADAQRHETLSRWLHPVLDDWFDR